MLLLGADTLCWHRRLEAGLVTLEDVLETSASLGCSCLALTLHHARDRDLAGLAALAARARSLGLRLVAMGDFLGEARHGDDVAVGSERVRRWLERAVALKSPVLRVASGFYRAELAGRPDLVELERRYVTEVLSATADEAGRAGVRLLLENHSDFSAREYAAIVEEVGGERIGVFLDLNNAVSSLEDPLAVVQSLAPLAHAAHVKDYVFESIQQPDAFHRRGFSVLYRYPGEGVAPLPALFAALRTGIGDRDVPLAVEGLDNTERDDQAERLARSLELLRSLA
jgi:sugar phosphate isomerase/epimerase